MLVIQELRNRASSIADSKALEIIEAAQKSMYGTRFSRLRKRIAIPVTEEEFEYRHALNNYVSRKIALNRERHSIVPGGYRIRTEMEYWRGEMDRIEFGFNVPIKDTPESFILFGHFHS